MKQAISILIIFCSIHTLLATPQSPEILIYKKDTLFIDYMPLEVLQKQNTLIRARMNKLFHSTTSAHWRGYTGTWSIINDSLFLTKIYNETEKEYTNLRKIFTKTEVTQRGVFAKWYSEEIEANIGDLLGVDNINSSPFDIKTIYTGKFYGMIHDGILTNVRIKYKSPSKIEAIKEQQRQHNDTMTHIVLDKYPVLLTQERSYKYSEICEFVNNNSTYTIDNIRGKVYVRVVIDKDGTVARKSILMDNDKKYNDEALRIVGLMQNWEPGIADGKKVKSLVVICYPCD